MKSIAKLSLNSFKEFYRSHKNNIFIGWFLRLGKFFYRLPYVQKRVYHQQAFNEAKYILSKIYGDKPITPYLKEFKNKKIFNKRFSLGHAEDFDVLMLYLFMRIKKPQTVIETGVASGRSSSVILDALYENNKGRLFSIDLPKFYEGEPKTYLTKEGRSEHSGFVPKGKTPGWLVPQNLRKQWNLILGDSKVELVKLTNQLKKIDIFYHDSDHSYNTMMYEFETTWPFIEEGGILLADDVKNNDAFNEFIKKIKPRFHHTYGGLGIILK